MRTSFIRNVVISSAVLIAAMACNRENEREGNSPAGQVDQQPTRYDTTGAGPDPDSTAAHHDVSRDSLPGDPTSGYPSSTSERSDSIPPSGALDSHSDIARTSEATQYGSGGAWGTGGSSAMGGRMGRAAGGTSTYDNARDGAGAHSSGGRSWSTGGQSGAGTRKSGKSTIR